MSHAVSTLSKIRSYYLNEDVILNEDEKNMLARWEEAFTFMRDTKSIAETVIMLQRRFPEYSKRVLYKDVNSALALFGDVIQYNKEAMRNMTNDFAIDYLNRCKKNNDRNNEKAALALLVKINKLDKDEEEQIDPSLLNVEPPIIEVPDHVANMIAALASNGAVNLMQLRTTAVHKLNERADQVQPSAANPGDSSTEGEVH
jgi:hypothetical protein